MQAQPRARARALSLLVHGRKIGLARVNTASTTVYPNSSNLIEEKENVEDGVLCSVSERARTHTHTRARALSLPVTVGGLSWTRY
jgi:hypothetical protein